MNRGLAPILLALAGCSASQGASPSSEVHQRYFATAVGRIESREESRQLVASVDGVIRSVMVGRGDVVRRGQVLMQIDCGPRHAQAVAARAGLDRSRADAALVQAGPRGETIVAARAARDRAEADLRAAQQDLDRATALLDRGFVSRREIDSRTATRDAARGARDQASAQLGELENGSRPLEIQAARAAARASEGEALAAGALARQCQVVSPIDGQVLQVLRQEGEFSGASQGTVLLVVGDLSARTVRTEIGERDVARIRIGMPVEVWIESQPGKRWRGRVIEMASVMGRRSARSLDPTDRFDRDIREAFVAVEDRDVPAVVGLRVTVGFVR